MSKPSQPAQTALPCPLLYTGRDCALHRTPTRCAACARPPPPPPQPTTPHPPTTPPPPKMARKVGTPPPPQPWRLRRDENLSFFEDAMGSMERILRTPIPLRYSQCMIDVGVVA